MTSTFFWWETLRPQAIYGLCDIGRGDSGALRIYHAARSRAQLMEPP